MIHPYLRSPGEVPWQTRLADGLVLARESGRRVLLVHGRATCGGTRALVEKTIAKVEIGEFLVAHFVAVASDVERAEPEVSALIEGLPRREPTPLCVYLADDGRLLHATAGGRPAAVFLNDMLEASMKR